MNQNHDLRCNFWFGYGVDCIFRFAHASTFNQNVILPGQCNWTQWNHQKQIRNVRLCAFTAYYIALRWSKQQLTKWREENQLNHSQTNVGGVFPIESKCGAWRNRWNTADNILTRTLRTQLVAVDREIFEQLSPVDPMLGSHRTSVLLYCIVSYRDGPVLHCIFPLATANELEWK